MSVFYYSSGLPFSECLASCLNDVQERIFVKGMVACIIIDGGQGKGKTTLASHIGDYVQGAYKKDVATGLYTFDSVNCIDFKRQLGVGGDDFKRKMRALQHAGGIIRIVVYDEAGDFNRRGALSAFNLRLNQIFEIFRAFKVLVIIVLPTFKVLDNVLLDKEIPRMLVHISNRNAEYGNFEIFGLKKMFYLLKRMKELTIPIYAYKDETPDYRGHFLNLPKVRENELAVYTIGGKFELMHMSNIAEKGLLPYSQLAGRLNRSIPWVKQKVALLKIKEDTVWKKVKYFRPEVVDVLSRESVRE